MPYHIVADCFRVVIRFAGVSYRRFMVMRYKFDLVTYVQRPLVINRRGDTERNLNVSNGQRTWESSKEVGRVREGCE